MFNNNLLYIYNTFFFIYLCGSWQILLSVFFLFVATRAATCAQVLLETRVSLLPCLYPGVSLLGPLEILCLTFRGISSPFHISFPFCIRPAMYADSDFSSWPALVPSFTPSRPGEQSRSSRWLGAAGCRSLGGSGALPPPAMVSLPVSPCSTLTTRSDCVFTWLFLRRSRRFISRQFCRAWELGVFVFLLRLFQDFIFCLCLSTFYRGVDACGCLCSSCGNPVIHTLVHLMRRSVPFICFSVWEFRWFIFRSTVRCWPLEPVMLL